MAHDHCYSRQTFDGRRLNWLVTPATSRASGAVSSAKPIKASDVGSGTAASPPFCAGGAQAPSRMPKSNPSTGRFHSTHHQRGLPPGRSSPAEYPDRGHRQSILVEVSRIAATYVLYRAAKSLAVGHGELDGQILRSAEDVADAKGR